MTDQITVPRELLLGAIDTINYYASVCGEDDQDTPAKQTQAALRAALEAEPAPVQEPVKHGEVECLKAILTAFGPDESVTLQQPRKAVKLTKEQLLDIFAGEKPTLRDVTLCRAVEQAVWEKLGVTE